MGWAGVPTGAGLVDGGVDGLAGQGWEMAVFEGCPVGWVFTGAGLVDGGSGRRGKGSGGVQGLRFRGSRW